MTPTFHSLKVAKLHRETEDSVVITFAVPENLTTNYQFIAGQYLTLKTQINGEEVRRSYSICKAPLENELSVAVKKVDQGKFSTWATEQLTEGTLMDVMTPSGSFQFNPESSAHKSYLLIAAGSGVTPILSIAKTILNQEPHSSICLVYGNKGFSSIMFREELEGLKNSFVDRLQLIHILSRESLGNPLQKGRVDGEKIKTIATKLVPSDTIDGVYICGPETMILDVKAGLEEIGVAPKNIHFELFGTAIPAKKKENTAPGMAANVTVILDGDVIEVPMDSNDYILDAAHKVGADLPYACKGGVCCTCKAKILEGTATMDVNYALEKDEVDAGYILTCQAHPTSEKLVVSFDD